MGRHRTERAGAEFTIDTGTARFEDDPGAPGNRILYVNGVPSSHISDGDPKHLDFEYMHQMARLLQIARPDEPLRVLHLGFGAGSMARHLDAARPGSHQIGVEIDGALAALVRQKVDLPRSPALRLRVGDARTELSGFGADRFEVIIRDVFDGDRTPASLESAEFFSDAARVLTSGGLLLANIGDRPPHRLARAQARFALDAFGHALIAADPGQLRGRRYGNLILVASHRPLPETEMARELRRGAAPARVIGSADGGLGRFADDA